MRRGRRRTLLVSLTALLAFPAAAEAAPAAVTLSACKRDAVTVAGKVRFSGSAARRVRGAKLQLRFHALPLFGLPRAGQWRTVGKRTSGSAAEAFQGLGADHWVGAMSWRFVKGRRTVASGVERSQAVRVGSSRGRAGCTIAEGLKPTDTTAPQQFILPADGLWHRAPAGVQLTAADDFSGVRSVSYSLDGGPMTRLPNGGKFTIGTEGNHTVTWEGTDVAGNTATRTDSVRVDAAPPSKPALAKPPAVTQSTTPTFQWAPATDTGSGIGAYAVTVLKGDGSLAMPKLVVGASATSVTAPIVLNEGETYTAILTAVDNSVGGAWITDSDKLTFRVDSHPDATFSPASTVLSGGANKTNFTITLDRAADPATVSPSTVELIRGDGSDAAHSAGCSNTPCTSIVVDPNSDLAEGHYELRLNGVTSADERLPFTASAGYAVPYTESGSISAALLCGNASTSLAYPVSAAPPGQTAFLAFDITYSGGPGWALQARLNGNPIGDPASAVTGGHFRLNFPSSGAGTLTFQLTSQCGGGNASALNLFGSRYP
jgi:hypothetical protein